CSELLGLRPCATDSLEDICASGITSVIVVLVCAYNCVVPRNGYRVAEIITRSTIACLNLRTTIKQCGYIQTFNFQHGACFGRCAKVVLNVPVNVESAICVNGTCPR